MNLRRCRPVAKVIEELIGNGNIPSGRYVDEELSATELHFIERRLKITLPDTYQKVMSEYPFAHNSFTAEFVLMNGVENLLEAAQTHTEPSNSFCIGSDGEGTIYFIDLFRPNSPVFAHNRRMALLYEEAADINDFVGRCLKAEKAIERRKKKDSPMNWWKIWYSSRPKNV
ncbi:MAG: SMI1/KNR4 family protein [Verrucomicrobia bacterium]|nr:SMI1/KNR4 family protein [Verrucomicrobiota bacterium]